jgi:hypothetical protein
MRIATLSGRLVLVTEAGAVDVEQASERFTARRLRPLGVVSGN